jgi:hypothetical protein
MRTLVIRKIESSESKRFNDSIPTESLRRDELKPGDGEVIPIRHPNTSAIESPSSANRGQGESITWAQLNC